MSQIDWQRSALLRHKTAMSLFQAVPVAGAILNEDRQILAMNADAMDMLGVASEADSLGLRLGELTNCISCLGLPGGCGSGALCEGCRFREAVVSALEGEPYEGTAEFEGMVRGVAQNICLKVKTTPLTGEENETFILMALQPV